MNVDLHVKTVKTGSTGNNTPSSTGTDGATTSQQQQGNGDCHAKRKLLPKIVIKNRKVNIRQHKSNTNRQFISHNRSRPINTSTSTKIHHNDQLRTTTIADTSDSYASNTASTVLLRTPSKSLYLSTSSRTSLSLKDKNPSRVNMSNNNDIYDHQSDINEDDDNHDEFNNDSDDDMDNIYINSISCCETYVAFQSLQQSTETCITIPINNTTTAMQESNRKKKYRSNHLSSQIASTTEDSNNDNNNHSSIRAVLECQLIEWFQNRNSNNNSNSSSTTNHHHNHFSMRVIREQIQFLQQQNVLRCIPIKESNQSLYISTTDYKLYLQQQHYTMTTTTTTIPDSSNVTTEPTDGVILDWWIQQLSNLSSTYIHVNDIEQVWSNGPPSLLPSSSMLSQTSTKSITTTSLDPFRKAADCVKWLQDHQYIISASNDHSTFQLWLPGEWWGTIILPTLLKLSKDIVLYVKRSSYKERSITSIIERFYQDLTTSTCIIPIEHVIIPYIVAQGYVQRVVHPSGTFLKLIEC